MGNVQYWFIADTHFSHQKIVEYCNRPFKTAEDMNKFIIEQWNRTVGKNDTVYHLGDFGFGSQEQITELVSQLNGKIYLIRGNHDTHKNQWYRDCGFIEVYDHPIIIKDYLVLSHEPIPFTISPIYVNLYGHIHDSPMFETWGKNSACLCVERHRYSPVNLDTISSHFI